MSSQNVSHPLISKFRTYSNTQKFRENLLDLKSNDSIKLPKKDELRSLVNKNFIYFKNPKEIARNCQTRYGFYNDKTMYFLYWFILLFLK